MKAFTVEWVYDDHLLSEDDGFTVQEMGEAGRLPVVRLPEVDAVLKEAVWAMELLQCMPPHRFADESLNRIQAFLARPDVAAWRERQEGKK